MIVISYIGNKFLFSEKPFGTSLLEAETLLNKLKEFYRPEQLFLVDHYLGKPFMQLIQPFR